MLLLEGLGKLKKFNDIIGTQTRYLMPPVISCVLILVGDEQ
jgi:hypothetical protein